MTKFDELLENIHYTQGTSSVRDSGQTYITINEKRQFIPSDGFDTTIAYEGDINSQKITFKFPLKSDEHNLSCCDNRILRWKNLASGIEGTSQLVGDSKTNGEDFSLIWEVPSDACTSAGTLSISIRFYDEHNGKIVYSWNTSNYSGLQIGQSLSSVDFTFPPTDEILIIDKDTKNILAPAGYNNVVCNYGDIGTSVVYFLISRRIGKKGEFDLLDQNASISARAHVEMNNAKSSYNLSLTEYTTGIDEKDGMIFLTWELPKKITAGPYGSGTLKIAIEFEKIVNGEIEKRWYSNSYNNLSIGSGIDTTEEEPEELTKAYVYELIEQYFANNILIIGANGYVSINSDRITEEGTREQVFAFIDEYFNEHEIIIE